MAPNLSGAQQLLPIQAKLLLFELGIRQEFLPLKTIHFEMALALEHAYPYMPLLIPMYPLLGYILLAKPPSLPHTYVLTALS